MSRSALRIPALSTIFAALASFELSVIL